MTEEMKAMKESYIRYLSAMTAEHGGERSVVLTFSPEPFVDKRPVKVEMPAKGFISKFRRR